MNGQLGDEWGSHLAEQMQDPEFRGAYERVVECDRRWAESHRSMFVVVIAAVLVGLAFIVGVVWYEMAGGR
jgi:hypothetical protein